MGGSDPRKRISFKLRLGLARFAQAFEGIWPALWPVFATLGLFLVISLFGLWQILPGWLHGIGLLLFLLAFCWTVFQAGKSFIWPSRDSGLGRLERVNNLDHRPLRSMEDQLSGGSHDEITRSLWHRHKERLVERLQGLKVGPPRSEMPKRDPWAFRIALCLLLIVALVESGSMAPNRLMQAFNLKRADGVLEQGIQLTIWVNPPDYTGLDPEPLDIVEASVGEDGLIDTRPKRQFPAGSEVLAQLHHLDETIERYALSLGESAQPFAAVGSRSAEARLVLNDSGELRVGSQEEVFGLWDIEILQDAPPEIALSEPPAATQRQVMRFQFEARDDYGVNSIALHLKRPGREDDGERIELIQPAEGATEIDDAAYLDLTPHPWSGLPVELRLEAVDSIEQSGFSDVHVLTLPTRNFTHPVAKAIVEQRRLLAEEPNVRREKVAAALNGLSHVPERFQNDSTVYMALRSMATRLMFDDSVESLDEVLELMWETALHLEDGSLSLASRELRELQEALRDALADGASDEELERLMDELRQALDNYLDALAQQAQQQMSDQPMQPMDQDAMAVDRQDLEQMLDNLRDMIQTGAREAAQDMLAQLQELLENLEVGQQNSQMQQGQQMMNQLQDMIQQQQELLDETFGLSRQEQQQGTADRPGEQAQQGQQGEQQQGGQQGQAGMPSGQPGQGQQSGGQSGQVATDQESLRRALGELMSKLGESGMQIPRAMGEAELSMRQARDALRGGQPGAALDPQANALDQLRQGGQAMMQEMQRMAGQQGQQGQQGNGQQFGQEPTDRDPLGRSPFNRGAPDQFGPRVPADLDLGKARAIMEELHRRSGQRHRPAEELDYLQRLLRRF